MFGNCIDSIGRWSPDLTQFFPKVDLSSASLVTWQEFLMLIGPQFVFSHSKKCITNEERCNCPIMFDVSKQNNTIFTACESRIVQIFLFLLELHRLDPVVRSTLISLNYVLKLLRKCRSKVGPIFEIVFSYVQRSVPLLLSIWFLQKFLTPKTACSIFSKILQNVHIYVFL